LLALNLDLHFNNTPDGLIFANLLPPKRRLLEFYMGRNCPTRYLRSDLELDRIGYHTTGLKGGREKGLEKGANGWRPAVSAS
jgi:hypothetical protein